jgi:molecular chaperone Hsp33
MSSETSLAPEPASTARGTDHVLRAMTDDGAFRVVVARTTDTSQAALTAQSTFGETGRRLSELITSTVLVRETMAPTHRVQTLLRAADNRGRLVADAHPDGGNRGLVSRAAGLLEVECKGGALEVLRTLYNGELHRGVVRIPDEGSISQGLMAYMASSEQVATMVAVACELDGDRVTAAGGYMVQLLPEVGTAPLAIMTERLRDFERIDGPNGALAQFAAEPGPLLDELLYGMPFTRLGDSPLSFQCQCSAVRVMSALASLSKNDLSELIREPVIEMSCDYCGKSYAVTPEQLKGMLAES